ncbi:MAG: hypothetical protein Q4F00_11470 [bacterium]|nr:hypothetical protein [bacterium]
MGSAYVPGLKVLENTKLQVERRLPLKGRVKVRVGERVSHEQIVAETEIPGRVEMINLAARLGLEADDLPSHMLCKVGDSVRQGQELARSESFWGLFKSSWPAPISGTLESVSEVSGQAVLRAPAQKVTVQAYVDGTVSSVLKDEGVIVETCGALVQGIFGVGGESAGIVHCAVKEPGETLTPELIRSEYRGSVVIGGSLLTLQAVRRALEVGVNGLVAGGIDDETLKEILGYDLGVAITGSEQLGLTLIITEGFGSIAMAQRTFELFKRHEGELASISGATQIRAGVIRPEIIIPSSGAAQKESQAPPELSLEVGAVVRLIREPHFGALATVSSLPAELVSIPTGARVRVAEIKLQDGSRMLIPRANLEIIAGS